jgi:hypothetical protein
MNQELNDLRSLAEAVQLLLAILETAAQKYGVQIVNPSITVTAALDAISRTPDIRECVREAFFNLFCGVEGE